MFEIILLFVVTGGITAFARGRGGNPWVWGVLTVVGYFLVPLVVTFVAVLLGADPKSVKADAQLWFFASAIAWVAIMGFCARFLLGHGRKKPSGMWSCPNCKYLNQHYAVICEACKHPFGEPAPR